jgi:hypothetical protein
MTATATVTLTAIQTSKSDRPASHAPQKLAGDFLTILIQSEIRPANFLISGRPRAALLRPALRAPFAGFR